jgi:ribosomal protein L30E
MKYEFEAFDDMEARMMLTELLESGKVSFGMKEEIKMQNILENKEPRKIEI